MKPATAQLPVPTEGTSRAHRTYHPPRLTPLGAWDVLTLVQSVPVGPGGFLWKGPSDPS